MYYYFSEVSSEKIVIKREASTEEYEAIEPYIKIVSKMLVDKNRIEPIMFAYQKLIESISLLNTQTDLYASRNIQYTLSGYLFEFKKFLDNWTTELKRKYGKNSKEFTIFKDAQIEEYEEHMEYRIMYRLRNYDQHCGSIISHVSEYIDENEKRAHRISMDRDMLLENFDEWKQPEIEYLKKQSEHIDVRPFILQLQKSIVNIYEKTMQIHFDKSFLNACSKIIDVANEFDNEDNIRIIANEEEIDEEFWSRPTKTINFINLMVPICKEILAIYFRNNARFIKILYYGERYKTQLKGCGIEINTEIAQKISQSQFINWNGQNMVRLLYQLELTKGDMYAVLADARFKHNQISELCTECSCYLKALCKNP